MNVSFDAGVEGSNDFYQGLTKKSTLIDFTLRWGRKRPDKIAYTFLRDGETVDGSVTYVDLDRMAKKLASALQQRLSLGDRVLLLFPSGIEFIVAFVACLYAGVIAVPVNNPKPKKLHWQRLATVVSNADVAMTLSTESNISKNQNWLSDVTSFDIRGLTSIETLLESGKECDWVKANIDQDSIAFLQYTSGSTGDPKGVVVTHGNLMHNCELIRTAFAHDQDTRFVTWLPLFHDLGLIGNILQTIYLGASCWLMTPAAFLQKPVRWLRAISRYRANTSMAPNFAYERCARQVTDAHKAELDLSHWRLALNGAEPIRADTIEEFTNSFADCGFQANAVFPAYGLAEGTLITATSDAGQGGRILNIDRQALANGIASVSESEIEGITVKIVSSGKSRAGQELIIVDAETKQRCESGEIGELWLKGDSVTAGYWRNENATSETFHAAISAEESIDNGVYMRTGDLAFEIDGWIYIAGRLKEVVIIRGQNYYPQDIERAAQETHSALRVDGGSAFTIDIESEERLILVQEVERTAMRKMDGDEVCRSIRHAVADEFDLQVHGIVLIRPATLVRTSSGKIQRRRCKQLFQKGKLVEVYRDVHDLGVEITSVETAYFPKASPDKMLDEGKVKELLLKRLSVLLAMDVAVIDPDMPLADYGLDSSVAISVSGEIADWTDREQDTNLLWICPSINALLEHIMGEFGLMSDVTDARMAVAGRGGG